GYDARPVLRLRISDRHFDHAIVRRLVVGQHVEIVAVIHRCEPVVDAMDDRANWRTGLAEIFRINIDALWRNAMHHGNHQVALVLGDLGADELHGSETLTLEALAEDELIATLVLGRGRGIS